MYDLLNTENWYFECVTFFSQKAKKSNIYSKTLLIKMITRGGIKVLMRGPYPQRASLF
jgi:hypothetical protein